MPGVLVDRTGLFNLWRQHERVSAQVAYYDDEWL